MANKKQIKIIRSGIAKWNEWREKSCGIIPDLSGANLNCLDLRDANLYRTDLSGAILRDANLIGADFREARLYRADVSDVNISGTDFYGADLYRADFSGTNLSSSDLSYVDLSYADLNQANLTGSILYSAKFKRTRMINTNFNDVRLEDTTFDDIDLSQVIGLINTIHEGPSTIGIDTIYRSKGNIPPQFLRDAGVPEEFIKKIPSLIKVGSVKLDSCFISFGKEDRKFCEKLLADLKDRGVRTWMYHEDARIGRENMAEIDRAIRNYDKVVLICSETSLDRPHVIEEIERACQREVRDKKDILFPVTVDNYVHGRWDHHRQADVCKKVIGDFIGWEDDPAKYEASLNKLIDDLNRDEQT